MHELADFIVEGRKPTPPSALGCGEGLDFDGDGIPLAEDRLIALPDYLGFQAGLSSAGDIAVVSRQNQRAGGEWGREAVDPGAPLVFQGKECVRSADAVRTPADADGWFISATAAQDNTAWFSVTAFGPWEGEGRGRMRPTLGAGMVSLYDAESDLYPASVETYGVHRLSLAPDGAALVVRGGTEGLSLTRVEARVEAELLRDSEQIWVNEWAGGDIITSWDTERSYLWGYSGDDDLLEIATGVPEANAILSVSDGVPPDGALPEGRWYCAEQGDDSLRIMRVTARGIVPSYDVSINGTVGGCGALRLQALKSGEIWIRAGGYGSPSKMYRWRPGGEARVVPSDARGGLEVIEVPSGLYALNRDVDPPVAFYEPNGGELAPVVEATPGETLPPAEQFLLERLLPPTDDSSGGYRWSVRTFHGGRSLRHSLSGTFPARSIGERVWLGPDGTLWGNIRTEETLGEHGLFTFRQSGVERVLSGHWCETEYTEQDGVGLLSYACNEGTRLFRMRGSELELIETSPPWDSHGVILQVPGAGQWLTLRATGYSLTYFENGQLQTLVEGLDAAPTITRASTGELWVHYSRDGRDSVAIIEADRTLRPMHQDFADIRPVANAEWWLLENDADAGYDLRVCPMSLDAGACVRAPLLGFSEVSAAHVSERGWISALLRDEAGQHFLWRQHIER